MKQEKSNLDEQLELKLLKIESRGFKLAFWGLMIAILAEVFVNGTSRAIMGELIVFLVLGLYMIVSRCCAGIGERQWDMNPKTILIISSIAGLFVAGFVTIFFFMHSSEHPFLRGTVIGLGTFMLCCLLCALYVQVVKKRQEKLNAEPADEAEDT